MPHIECSECGSREHMSGYGLAAGGIGAYTICECGAVLEFEPDIEGLTDEEAEKALKWRRPRTER